MANRHLKKLIYLLVLQVMPVLADDAIPSIELLEFLAEMKNTDGEWVDPLYMKELAMNEDKEESRQVEDNE